MNMAGVAAFTPGRMARIDVLCACTSCPVSARGNDSGHVEKYYHPWGHVILTPPSYKSLWLTIMPIGVSGKERQRLLRRTPRPWTCHSPMRLLPAALPLLKSSCWVPRLSWRPGDPPAGYSHLRWVNLNSMTRRCAEPNKPCLRRFQPTWASSVTAEKVAASSLREILSPTSSMKPNCWL